MKFRGWYEDRDYLMRHITYNMYGTTEGYRILDEYERCYTNQLYDGATYDWSQDWDHLNKRIQNKDKMPQYKSPIGKDIVDTLSSNVFGYSNFPEISIVTKKDIYPKRDLIKEALDEGLLDEDDLEGLSNSEKRKLKINLCNDELKKLNDLFCEEKLMLAIIASTKKGMIMGKSILTYRFVEGEVIYEVINYKHVESKIKFHEDIPDKIIEFTEMYIFEDVDDKDPTKFCKYYHKRVFNENEIILYHPAKIDGSTPPNFRVKKRSPHNFGYCPAVLMKTENGESVYAGQVDNIRSYVYLTNDLMLGLTRNMNPQYAAIEEATNNYSAAGQTSDVMRRGAIWKFKNTKDVRALAHNSGGYSEAREIRKEIRKEILDAVKCRILNVEMDNEESGVALALKMSPDASAIGQYRISFGTNGLVKLMQMVYKSAKLMKKNDGEYLNDLIDFEFPEKDLFKFNLIWGDLTPPTEDKIMKAITNSLTAYKGGIMDLEHAVKRISKYFDVIDVEDLIRILKKAEHEMMEEYGEDSKQLFGRLKQEIKNSNTEKISKETKESKGEDSKKDNKSKYLQEKD